MKNKEIKISKNFGYLMNFSMKMLFTQEEYQLIGSLFFLMIQPFSVWCYLKI